MKVYIENQVTACLSSDVMWEIKERTLHDPQWPISEVELARVINDALQRYFYLLEEKRERLEDCFYESEIGLMCDACNGTRWNMKTIRFLPRSIEDALEVDRLDEKWEVNGEYLVRKLKELDLLSMCALVDAIERFWSGPYHKERPDYSKVLG